jgi:hypothetical protein
MYKRFLTQNKQQVQNVKSQLLMYIQSIAHALMLFSSYSFTS